MRNNRMQRFLALILICTCLFGMNVKAETRQGKVLAVGKDGTNILLYVDNPGENLRIECQIGTASCESVTVSPISEDETPIKTIFLVDNSLSVQEKYRPMIADILTQLAANRMNGEIYSVGVFSEEITWLLEDSSNYIQIQEAIKSISYQNQETYLTDVLYELLSQEADTGFKRIIIISDGVDNKTIGYTKEELYSLIEANPWPIYTLGCTYKSNNEELKNMFALSRLTQGESWLMDEVTDATSVVAGVENLNDAYKITIMPDDAICDGSTKGISLRLINGEETIQYTLEMQMPFAEKNAEVERSSAAVPTPEATVAVNPETEAAAESEEIHPVIREDKQSYGIYIACGIGIIVVVGLCGAAFFLRRKKGGEGFQPAPDTSLFSDNPVLPKRQKRETVLVGRDDERNIKKPENRKTYMAWERKIGLKDIHSPEKVFYAMLGENTILVGYNEECQIRLNYEESISGKHCSLMEKSGKVYIENLSKTNPTLINGRLLKGEEQLKDGDVLTLGRLEMKVLMDR